MAAARPTKPKNQRFREHFSPWDRQGGTGPTENKTVPPASVHPTSMTF